ncbi:MAG: AAA family ATPase [Parasporobacterium sp.]|nr:AAA family ATPase [Parasporobacterium sp.]
MQNNKKVSALELSVGADKEQTPPIDIGIIPTEASGFNNDFSTGLKTFTLDEALDSYFEPKDPVIENLLNPGTYIMAGASKIGKSFLVAEIAFHVAAGRNLWNARYKTHPGSVLYLALEDDIRRIQTRFSRMFGTEGSTRLHFATASKTMDEGLVLQLLEYLNEMPDTKLIIIDTLQKIRGLSNETISYSRDYEVITQLKNLSDSKNLCILIVHHTRKQEADDCFEKISGTNGLMGSADGAMVMTRKRGSPEARLQITGRDQQDQIINLEQNPDTLLWEFKDEETTLWEEKPDPVVEQICRFIEKEKVWYGTATELVEEAKITGIAPNALTRKLNPMSGYLLNKRGILYQTKRNSNCREVYLEQKEE